MIVHHVVTVLYTYHTQGDSLEVVLNNIIAREAQVGFNCVGVEKVFEEGINKSEWLLLFEGQHHPPGWVPR